MDQKTNTTRTKKVPMDVTHGHEKSMISEDIVMSVFENGMIFSIIFSFLNFGELQTMGRVSKYFYDMTHSYRRFSDRVKLKLSIEGHNKDAYSTKFFWKSVICFMDKMNNPTRLGMTSKILFSAENLELIDYKRLSVPIKCYTYFFTKSPNLKSLILDLSILNRDLKNLLRKKCVIQNLSILDKFSIIEAKRNRPILENCKFWENIELLLYIPWNLKSLTFGKVDIDVRIVRRMNTFVEMIEKNKDSLCELVIHIQHFYDSGLKTIVCQNLSILEVTINEYSQDDFIEFIKIQSLLTILTIRNKYGINTKLLNVIQEKSSNLKKLSLKTPYFIRSPLPPLFQENEDENELPVLNPLLEPIDITFLSSIIKLVEFELFQKWSESSIDCHITIAQALNVLPNTHIKALNFSGMNYEWVGGEETLGGINCFSRFPNLTKLCLLECDDGLNNDILQFIITTLTSLKVFYISRSSRITGVGLTGMDDGNISGVSLKSLKGIVDCSGLHLVDYLSAIQFLELTDLDLRTTPRLSTQHLIEIITQNPSLERVCTNTLDIVNLKIKLKTLNTRIKSEGGIINMSKLSMYSSNGSMCSDSDDDWLVSDR